MTKSAGLAAAFVIGLGQIYNGQIVKGLLIVVVQAVNVALMHVLIGFVFYPVVLVYAVFDAYRSAERINGSSGRTTYPGRVRQCGGCLFWILVSVIMSVGLTVLVNLALFLVSGQTGRWIDDLDRPYKDILEEGARPGAAGR